MIIVIVHNYKVDHKMIIKALKKHKLKFLIISLLILSNPILGQTPGKKIDGPIIIADTLTIHVGDVLHLGEGSDPKSGDFLHIYAPKNTRFPLVVDIIRELSTNNDEIEFSKAIPQKNLNKGFAGRQLIINGFSKVSNKKKKKKVLGVINMKEYQFVEGVFFNNVVVDFEEGIKSGEIIKISAPTENINKSEVEKKLNQFEMSKEGILPVIINLKNKSKNQLYNNVLEWADSYFVSDSKAIISKVPDEEISINSIMKNIKIAAIMGMDYSIDLPYLLQINFTENEIRIKFILGDENGNIFDENGKIVANIAPSSIFNKKGKIKKMAKISKLNLENAMNDISTSLIHYVSN